MKYLFLIIRHMFPRKRWRIRRVISAVNNHGDIPEYQLVIQEDQFGNIKKTRIG
jgi:hypothetical protein